MAAPACRCPPPRRSWRPSTPRAATAPPATRRCTSWAPSCGTARRRRRPPTCRRSPPASCACRRSASPSRPAAPTPPALRTFARSDGDHYIVNGQKVWTSRAEHSDLMLLLARTTPRERGEVAHRRAVHLHRRHARGARQGPDDPADPHHDEPQLLRGVLRQHGGAGREPGRRGRPRLPLHPRRHERRAPADRRRMHRRRQMVHPQGDRLRQGAPGVRPADRAEPGRRSSRSRAPTRRCARPS